MAKPTPNNAMKAAQGASISAMAQIFIPAPIGAELDRQKERWGGLEHDCQHDRDDWADIIEGCDDDRESNRRRQELRAALINDDAAEFDNIMAEYGAISISYFRARAARAAAAIDKLDEKIKRRLKNIAAEREG